jgi:hypothetical protein
MVAAARDIRDHGSFARFADALPFAAANGMMERPAEN